MIFIALGFWAVRPTNSSSAKDYQLVLIVVKDMDIYIVIFNSLMAYILMNQQLIFESFLLKIASFLVNIPFSIGLYTSLIISKTFQLSLRINFLTKKT